MASIAPTSRTTPATAPMAITPAPMPPDRAGASDSGGGRSISVPRKAPLSGVPAIDSLLGQARLAEIRTLAVNGSVGL
jgi:hypothetical protein